MRPVLESGFFPAVLEGSAIEGRGDRGALGTVRYEVGEPSSFL